MNYVFVVYLINLAIVLGNLAIYVRNCALDRQAESLGTAQVALGNA